MDALYGINLTIDKNTKYEEYLSIQHHKERLFYINEGVTQDLAYEILMYIHLYNLEDEEIEVSKRKPIKIYINSEGGDTIMAAWQIIDAIQLSKTPVYTINTGAALSAGGLILMVGHKRYTFPNATFLWHQGSIGYGADTGKFRNFSKFTELEDVRWNDFVIKHTTIQKEELEKRIHEDWWMKPEEMIERGIVDEIIKELI